MSLDTRNSSALFKRAEQLKRWEESEMNRQPIVPKNSNNRRIKFSSGCIFLAACVSGDKEEVSRLIDNCADIDTANVDGLTALHQACIDNNLDMVEFLVAKGADVNRKDNEGWTPLHATSSCGFLSIARYLIESGADLAAINSDGELALDLACSDAMEDMIQKHVDDQGIDCEEARQMEEKMMLSDAKKWLRSESTDVDKPHPKTGATALHVAAAKGYIKVLSLLLDGRADVDKQDIDGWTPIHAAAYWGQKEAAQMLINSQADLDIQNYSGQTAKDIAQKDIVSILDEARKNIKRPKPRPASQIRITDTIENNMETPPKVIRVEVKPIESKDKEEVPEKENQPTESEVILRRTQSFESDEKFYQKYQELRARIKANSCPILPAPLTVGVVGSVNNTKTTNYIVQRSASLKDHRQLRKTTTSLTTTTPTVTTTNTQTPSSPPTSPTSTPTSTPSSGQIRRSFVPPTRDEESETQRKAHAKRVRETRRSTQGVTLDEIKSAEQLVKKKNSTNSDNDTTTPAATTIINDRVPSVNLNSDEKIPEATEQIAASYTLAAPLITSGTNSTDEQKEEADDVNKITATYTISPNLSSIASINASLPPPSVPISKDKDKDKHESNDIKVTATITATINVPTNNNNNTISNNNNINKKTESEELTKLRTPSLVNNDEISTKTTNTPNSFTKRSLFDIDNANSLTLAEKLRQEANKYADEKDTSTKSNTNDTVLLRKDSIGSTPSSPLHQQIASERRPSWRLKVDAGSKFKLEDASTPNPTYVSSNISNDVNVTINKPALPSLAQRRQNGDSNNINSTRPVSAPVLSTTANNDTNDRVKDTSANIPSTPTTEITIPLRRLKSNEDNKENDKENENRSAQATQAVIQRRRRPKRRSTGVVHVDMEDIEPDRQDSPVDGDEKESGSERSRSRLGSTNSLAPEVPDHKSESKENGGDFIDYKALYEAAKADNDKLKLNLRKKDEEVYSLKAALDRFTNATTKNSLSELEKREKRAMERKVSEMEEELKQLDSLKTENQRLKDENGALIRVISKLSR